MLISAAVYCFRSPHLYARYYRVRLSFSELDGSAVQFRANGGHHKLDGTCVQKAKENAVKADAPECLVPVCQCLYVYLYVPRTGQLPASVDDNGRRIVSSSVLLLYHRQRCMLADRFEGKLGLTLPLKKVRAREVANFYRTLTQGRHRVYVLLSSPFRRQCGRIATVEKCCRVVCGLYPHLSIVYCCGRTNVGQRPVLQARNGTCWVQKHVLSIVFLLM